MTLVVLTTAGACGSPVGPQQQPSTGKVETTHVIAMPPVDAALPDAPPLPKLACEGDSAVAPGPAPEAALYCTKPDGAKSGPFVALFPDGTIAIKGAYRDNQLDGPWERRYDDGAIAEQGQYAAGQKDGHWKQLGHKGEVLGEYDLTAGTGVDKRWYDDGPLYRERAMKAGVASGPSKTYLPDGTLVIKESFSKGKLDGSRTSGTLKTMLVTEDFGKGVRYGERKIWQFGILIYEEQFDYGGRLDGPYTIWHEPKNPRVKGQFKHGRRDGQWTWWDFSSKNKGDGGRLQQPWRPPRTATGASGRDNKQTFAATYKDGRADGTVTYWNHAGTELGHFDISDGTGTWITYQPNGHTAASKEHLYHGERDGVYQELAPNKKVLVEGHFSGGIKWGSWKEWTIDGVPIVEKTWKKGRLDGVFKKYIDGKLGVETTYKDGRVDGAYTEYRTGKPALTGSYVDEQAAQEHVDDVQRRRRCDVDPRPTRTARSTARGTSWSTAWCGMARWRSAGERALGRAPTSRARFGKRSARIKLQRHDKAYSRCKPLGVSRVLSRE